MSDGSQQVNRAGMRGLVGENLAVEFLRLLQATGLMVPHGQFEGLLEGEWGRHYVTRLGSYRRVQTFVNSAPKKRLKEE